MNTTKIRYFAMGFIVLFFSALVLVAAGASTTNAKETPSVYAEENESTSVNDIISEILGLFSVKSADEVISDEDHGIDSKLSEVVLVKEENSIDRDEIISIIETDFKQKVIADDNSSAKELGVEIYAGLNEILPSLSGAGKNAQYSINIEKLSEDPLFASKDYLGREYSLKISLTGSNSNGIFSDTASWYACDAAKIAKSVFDSSSGSEIGVLGIVFSDPDTGSEVTFILSSKDAEQIRPYWSGDESSLRLSDWSSFSKNNINLIMYENPNSTISLNPAILSKTGYDYYFEEPDLNKLIKDSSGRLIESFYDISTAVSDKNYNNIITSSKKLLELCYNEKKVFSRLLSQNKLSGDVKNYITAIDCISDAGSDYWYGAVSVNQDIIQEGNKYFLQGVGILNTLNETGITPEVDDDVLSVVDQTPLKNCYSLNTPVHYKDSSECNDISVNIKSYRILKTLYLKDGDVISEIKPGYGKIFVAVVMDIYHMGYRGGSTSVITTPSNNDFTLIYEGVNYKDVTPDYYIRNVGEVYSQKKLKRLENFESNLVYEIDCPETFDPDLASLKLNLGSKWGEHIWNFGDSGNA